MNSEIVYVEKDGVLVPELSKEARIELVEQLLVRCEGVLP